MELILKMKQCRETSDVQPSQCRVTLLKTQTFSSDRNAKYLRRKDQALE